MSTVVIEHVALNELPAAWRDRLAIATNMHVTVSIEEETELASQTVSTDSPMLGMWRDREEMADVECICTSFVHPAIILTAPATMKKNNAD